MQPALKIIPDSPQSISVEQALRSFLLDCRARNLSPQTIAWYEKRIMYLVEFLRNSQPQGAACPLLLITEHSVKMFIQHHMEREQRRKACTLSSYTVKGTVVSLKVFFTYLYNEGFLRENIAEKIKAPKVCKKIIQTLSGEQIQELLRVMDRGSFTGFRDYCMLLMFLDTGIRLSELMNLMVSGVNLSTNTLSVLGKGNKERIVPFGMSLRKALEKYLVWRGEIRGKDALFVDQFGEKLKLRRIEAIVEASGKKAGIRGVRMSPHTLRHTFAKMSLLAGMDAVTLQYILGHTSLEMVRNYVNLTSQEVAIHKNRFSLMDRMELKSGVQRKKLWK